jgi:hypothetical protein
MVPDLDLQLQVAIKALVDNIVPAVDPANKVAVEQLYLTVATLTMVRNRVPLARRFTRRLLEDDLLMAEAVRELIASSDITGAAALAQAVARGRDALADPEMDTHELENVRAHLTGTTVSAIVAAQGGAAAAALEKLVLNVANRPLARHRAWCLPAGFEPDPSQIEPIETLLQQGTFMR